MGKVLKLAKRPREMNTEEAMNHLFHPKVVEHLKNVKDTKIKPPLKKV